MFRKLIFKKKNKKKVFRNFILTKKDIFWNKIKFFNIKIDPLLTLARLRLHNDLLVIKLFLLFFPAIVLFFKTNFLIAFVNFIINTLLCSLVFRIYSDFLLSKIKNKRHFYETRAKREIMAIIVSSFFSFSSFYIGKNYFYKFLDYLMQL